MLYNTWLAATCLPIFRRAQDLSSVGCTLITLSLQTLRHTTPVTVIKRRDTDAHVKVSLPFFEKLGQNPRAAVRPCLPRAYHGSLLYHDSLPAGRLPCHG